VIRSGTGRLMLAAFGAIGLALAPCAGAGAQSASDSLAAAGTVRRFHQALEAGDSATAIALLTPDAEILESGDRETAAEYRASHLAADIEFARAVATTGSATRVVVRGGAAWAITTTTARGRFRGRSVSSAGAELMVLTRGADGWRIAAIHWSSRKRDT
jgi:ketosteroid isomerase-like protein